MPNYVLAFRGQPDRTPRADEDAQWGAWFTRLGPAMTDSGNRVGRTRFVAADGADNGNSVLSGYILISADDLDAAAELARGCPGLGNGVSVEIGELAPQ